VDCDLWKESGRMRREYFGKWIDDDVVRRSDLSYNFYPDYRR